MGRQVINILDHASAGASLSVALTGLEHLIIVSLAFFLFGVTSGGVLYPWRSANCLAPLIIGILGIISFCLHGIFNATETLFPLRIFSLRTAAAGLFSVWVFVLILWAIAYYVILYLCSIAPFPAPRRSPLDYELDLTIYSSHN